MAIGRGTHFFHDPVSGCPGLSGVKNKGKKEFLIRKKGGIKEFSGQIKEEKGEIRQKRINFTAKNTFLTYTHLCFLLMASQHSYSHPFTSICRTVLGPAHFQLIDTILKRK